MGKKRIFSFGVVVALITCFAPSIVRGEGHNETMVFFSAAESLYRIPVSGGEAERLADLNGRKPAIQPGGKMIAFIGRGPTKEDVFIARADGSNPKNVSNLDRPCDEVVWSRDGTKVAFLAGSGKSVAGFQNNDVYVVDADGRNLVNVTQSEQQEYSPQWGPDARWLAFKTSRGSSDALAIWNSAKGSAVVWKKNVLTFRTSPKENKIAFIAGAENKRRLYLLDVLTRQASQVSLGTNDPDDLSFSPDGNQLAVTGGGVWLVQADGKSLRNIVQDIQGATSPVWSPDGKRLVYQVPESVFGDSATQPGSRTVTTQYWLWGVASSGVRRRQ